MKLFYTLFAATILFMHSPLKAATYTAQASGNYTAGATWVGGVAPSSNPVNDVIVIPSGITVTLTGNVSMSGLLGSLNVDGTLTGTSHTLHLSALPFSGTGTITVDSFSGMAVGPLNFGGTINANKFDYGFTTVTAGTPPVFSVSSVLYGKTTMGLDKGSMNLFSGATIVVTGGGSVTIPTPFNISGAGAFNLPTTYNVLYTNGNIEAGAELSGTGQVNVEVAAGSSGVVKLMGDYTVRGMLTLTSGTLDLNNHDMIFESLADLSASGTGNIKSSSASDIEVKAANSLAGELRFATGGNTIDDFVIDFTAGANKIVKLGGNVKITGQVEFLNGKVDVQSHKLILITGAVVNGGSADRYIITGTGGALADDVGAGQSKTFHVGTAAQYAPCIVQSNNNTVYNGLEVSVNPGVRNMGSTGTLISTSQPCVNTTWFVDNPQGTPVDMNLELFWSTGMEVNNFNRSKAYISHLTGATWDKTATASATTHTSGMFSIKREGITHLSPFAVFDDKTVGIEELAATPIRIYPNPANDVLHIDMPLGADAKATVYNATGQAVLNTQAGYNTNTINISTLPQGMYYLQLKGGGVNSTVRFVKQ